jgi:two-component sensor histidine kinase
MSVERNILTILGLLTLCLIPVFMTVGYAQSAFSYTLSDENGLPSNEVYQIVQDNQGYLWIGCDAGLYRYDGNTFTSYKNALQNGRSISNLVFDAKGFLWCRNFSGQLFRVVDDSLHLIVDDSKSANKFQICFTDQPGYWRIDNQTISQHDEKGKALYNFQWNLGKDLIGNGTDMLYHAGKLWIEVAAKGLYCFDIKSKKLSFVAPTALGISYQNQRLFVNNGQLFLMRSESAPSVNNYLYLINPEDLSVLMFYDFYNPHQIRNYHFSEDSKNRLWIGSSFGAICIPNVFLFTAPERICFIDHKISSVLEDNEGNFWFTDLQKGLHFIPSLDIQTLDDQVDIENRGEITTLKSIDANTLVIGHYDGSVGFFNPTTKKCTYPDEINKHKGIAVKDIQYKNGLVYISRGHLLIYDLKKNTSFIPQDFGNARGIVLHQNHLFAVHPENVTQTDLSSLQNGQHIRVKQAINRGGRAILLEPKTDHLYVALADGLHIKNVDKFEILKFENAVIHASVLTAGKDAIYAGTQNQGVLEIKNGKVIRRFIYASELSDITIRALFASGNFLWVCTNSDFLRVNLTTGKWHKYSRNIGINPKDVSAISKNGEFLYIGSKKRLLQIPIDFDPVNWKRPHLLLEKVAIDNKKLNRTSSELPYDFSNLRFDFSAVSYRSKKDLRYEYRLVGFDTSWTSISYENPTVTFSSLPAGNYRFEVRALNESDLPGNTARYSFQVLAPIWQKGWFYFVVSIASLLVMASIFQARIRTIRRRNEIEKKLVNSQLSALKAQMNPHFMYNALNSIQALILKQDIRNSNLYLSKFSNLMRKVLDASGREQITLKEETDILHLYLDLEKLRFGEEFNFSILVDSAIDPEAITLPSMILQPYVENALKHGLLHKKGQKILTLNFNQLNDHLVCTIRDNGVGRERSAEIKARFAAGHKSFATEATEKRVELLNTYVKDKYQVVIIDLEENETAIGTEVRIKIPLNFHSES